MTLDKLIARLEHMRDQVGGDCEVVVLDGEGEWGFGLYAAADEDGSEVSETGVACRVCLDVTMQPE